MHSAATQYMHMCTYARCLCVLSRARASAARSLILHPRVLHACASFSIPDRIKETACYTNALEPIFKKNNDDFNKSGLYKILPNQYFGDRHGLFRMFPGRHFEKCGEYDPRIRPWYVAGSAQPKSVVIIMDLSGSMSSKIKMVREATNYLISTMTFADSFAVLAIAGDGTATVYPRLGGFAYGTKQNKANAAGVVSGTTWQGLEVLKQVTRLTGTQNSLEAIYGRAFDMWNTTSASTVAAYGRVEDGSGEPTVLPGDDSCVKSLLLLTDATLDYTTATSTSAYIAARNVEHNAALFFYSIEASVDVDGQAPKAMACSLGGVWGAVPSKSQHEQHTAGANPDAVGYSYSYSFYMSSFSKFYEIKLATTSADYTVWSEPYLFYPSNLLGTTVSSPIFDRTVPSSPRLLGVVGVDMLISAAESSMVQADASLTDVTARSLILPELARRARRRCPAVSAVSQCDLQALRRYSGGEKGMCAGQCWQTTSFDQAACLDYHKYPRPRPGKRGSLFANDHWAGKPGRDRVCCGIGTNVKKNCARANRRALPRRRTLARAPCRRPCRRQIRLRPDPWPDPSPLYARWPPRVSPTWPDSPPLPPAPPLPSRCRALRSYQCSRGRACAGTRARAARRRCSPRAARAARPRPPVTSSSPTRRTGRIGWAPRRSAATKATGSRASIRTASPSSRR